MPGGSTGTGASASQEDEVDHEAVEEELGQLFELHQRLTALAVDGAKGGKGKKGKKSDCLRTANGRYGVDFMAEWSTWRKICGCSWC
jgi:hypothetical protein